MHLDQRFIRSLPAGAESAVTLAAIRDAAADETVFVIDDDPTGSQTVRDALVMTEWDDAALLDVIDGKERLVFLLTNSRSLPAPAALRIARRTGAAIARIRRQVDRSIVLISRSDSTLRGHFPIEVDALIQSAGMLDARILLAPFFGAGGRITLDDTHYIKRDGEYVPVGDTVYARDAVFGYQSSNLREWIREKAGSDRSVASVSLRALRTDGPTAVLRALQDLPPGGICIVNAVLEQDIEVVALGTILATKAGVAVIARSAASFVRARIGSPVLSLLGEDDVPHGRPGLIVIGSHVPMTTRQVDHLLATCDDLRIVRLPVDQLLDARQAAAVVAGAVRSIDQALGLRHSAVLMTSRLLFRGPDATVDLGIASRISGAISTIVARLQHRPAWIVAKGGITSSDVATRGLAVRSARVLGQLAAGVSLWRCGRTSKWPDLPYVVFPGNVGTVGSLTQVVVLMSGASP